MPAVEMAQATDRLPAMVLIEAKSIGKEKTPKFSLSCSTLLSPEYIKRRAL
jgi:hypothetical protein